MLFGAYHYLCGWFSSYKNAYPNPCFQKALCNVKKIVHGLVAQCSHFCKRKSFELWNIFSVAFTAKTTASSTLFPQILCNFGIPDVVLAKR